MINKNKLKGKIIENGYNVEAFAREMLIDKSSLYRKLNGKQEFSISEANKIVCLLNLSIQDAYEIFFNIKVA